MKTRMLRIAALGFLVLNFASGPPVVAQSNPGTPNGSAAHDTQRTDVRLSFWAAEVAKLAQAGVEDEVIISFLDNVGTLNLGADQIIYLTKIGVSRDVIAIMLQHDFEISCGIRPLPALTLPMVQPFSIRFTTNAAAANTIEQGIATPAKAAPAKNNSTRDPDDIIGPDQSGTTGEFFGTQYAPGSVDGSTPVRSGSTRAEQVYAVREPYPVQLTDPILVIRMPARTPNIMLLESFR
jgi:hypothetical protein